MRQCDDLEELRAQLRSMRDYGVLRQLALRLGLEPSDWPPAVQPPTPQHAAAEPEQAQQHQQQGMGAAEQPKEEPMAEADAAQQAAAAAGAEQGAGGQGGPAAGVQRRAEAYEQLDELQPVLETALSGDPHTVEGECMRKAGGRLVLLKETACYPASQQSGTALQYHTEHCVTATGFLGSQRQCIPLVPLFSL